MKKLVLFSLLTVLICCSSNGKYDVVSYFDVKEQDEVLTSIITYIFSAPPYVKSEDRFNDEHRKYYSLLAPKFSINKYFIAEDGTHFFYVIRPGPKIGEKRGVGGHYKMKDNYQFTEFREEYVTPLLTEEEVTGRCAFLFDEMVKGSLEKYLGMETYVQWPNKTSYYDTITYEWKLKPEL